MEMESEKKYSAESKGYNDKIYEIRFIPVMERPEYQEGPVKEALLQLKQLVSADDFEKYINNGLIRITYDGSRLMLITKSEIYRTILSSRFFVPICQAFNVGNFRVVSEVNGY